MNAIRNRDKWDSLSMREKSDMMKVAVQQGIYNLSDIRKAYNEYAEGGNTEDEYYAGTLPEVEVVAPSSNRFVAQSSSTYVAPYISEVPKIRFVGSRYDRDTLTDKGGKPASDMTYEERWERQKKEKTRQDWKNLYEGLQKTVGTSIAGANLFTGGPWAAIRLSNGNKASTVGQLFSKYLLATNALDNYNDAVDIVVNPSISGAVDLATGLALSRYRDFGSRARQFGELVGQGANTYNIVDNYKALGGPLIELANKYAEGGPENQPYTPFLNETPETPMQAAMRQIQSPEARAAYWNATHPQTTSETPIVAQPDGTFRRETRNIPLNTSAEAARTALEFTPVIGDIFDAVNVYDEARQGNYGTAAALAGLALLPNYAEKPLKKGLRKIGLFDNATTAAKATPAEWTAAQDAAIARGDIAEAQRLRDLHFKVSAPDTKIVNTEGMPQHVYHGTTSKPFTVFDINAPRKHDLGTYGKGFYFTPNKNTAINYGEDKTLFDTYLNLKTPYSGSMDVVDNVGNFKNLKELKNYYKRQGISEDELNNIDWGNFNITDGVNAGDEVMVLKPDQIKSAKAVTYDDKGVRIPLGERDNFNINDFRYIWPTALLGGTAAVSYANQQGLGGPLVQLANRYEEGGPTDESNNIVDWIIGEEGFNSKPENIGDGKITLGSGLTNSKWHKIYNKKGTWTAEDNRAAVAEEVENRRRWAEQNVPNWGELPADSQNALLSYKYNYNFTPKNSPKLFKALEDRNYEEAARQMDATSSNPRFRKGLQARRQREQEMFMRGINSMNASEPEVVEEIPQEESIYTPPQRVLDNMAIHNGRYMIMGNPPLAGVRNTVLDALRRLKALNLFVEGGPLVDLANRTL